MKLSTMIVPFLDCKALARDLEQVWKVKPGFHVTVGWRPNNMLFIAVTPNSVMTEGGRLTCNVFYIEVATLNFDITPDFSAEWSYLVKETK